MRYYKVMVGAGKAKKRGLPLRDAEKLRELCAAAGVLATVKEDSK